jgi:hypothetical protein
MTLKQILRSTLHKHILIKAKGRFERGSDHQVLRQIFQIDFINGYLLSTWEGCACKLVIALLKGLGHEPRDEYFFN